MPVSKTFKVKARIPEDSIFVVLLDNTRAGMRGNDLVGISNNILPILYDINAPLPKPVAYIELLRLIKKTYVDDGITQFKNVLITNKDAYNFIGLEDSLNHIRYHYIANGDITSTTLNLSPLTNPEVAKASLQLAFSISIYSFAWY